MEDGGFVEDDSINEEYYKRFNSNIYYIRNKKLPLMEKIHLLNKEYKKFHPRPIIEKIHLSNKGFKNVILIDLFEIWYSSDINYSRVAKWILQIPALTNKNIIEDIKYLDLKIVKKDTDIWKYPSGFMYPFDQPNNIEKPIFYFKRDIIETIIGICDIQTATKLKLIGYELYFIDEIINILSKIHGLIK